MKVQCGKYELLDSIFVTQVEGKPIDITLEDPSDIYRFSFNLRNKNRI